MKKLLYYVITNGYDYIAYVEGKEARILDDVNFTKPFSTSDDANEKAEKALNFLETIEDASSWSCVMTSDDLYTEWEENSDDIEVIAELEIEHSLL